TIGLPLDGQPVRDILHVDDFSRACQAFIDSAHSSGLYNLGGGVRNSASLRELVDMTGKLIELEPRIVDEGPLPPNVPVRYVSDITKIREQLGWQPQIGIEEGLRSLL
ncbi:MAG TPA: GDP-mannose 4,6-dehydratase, partial [Pyrinomonadaceae bacterium]